MWRGQNPKWGEKIEILDNDFAAVSWSKVDMRHPREPVRLAYAVCRCIDMLFICKVKNCLLEIQTHHTSWVALCSICRAQAVWKSTGPRLIERIFRHYETIGDPQMLASMACVLGSASGPDACLGIVPKGQDSMATYDRYMTSYAERLYQWGALGTRTEIVNHQSETIQQPPDMQIHGRPSSSEHAAPPPLCEGGGHKVISMGASVFL